MSNPKLQKIIKLTQVQYDILSNGGTVGGYTGLNDNYLYLIQDDTNYQPLDGDLTAIAALSGMGYLKRTGNNVWTLDNSTFATQTWVTNQGYITGITSSDVTTALGYTPVDPSNISAVGFSGDYDDLLNKPSIPTNTSDLNNDSGFITGDDVPSNQSTSVVVKNAITNINGRVFQNYTATLITAGGYTFYQIYKNGNNPTEAEAAEYMRYMTGSTFVPKYNYDFPKQTIFTFEDRSTWKPQFSSIDGLRLYRLTTPLALESQIPTSYIASVSVSGNLLTITDSSGNTTTFASDAPQILDLRV